MIKKRIDLRSPWHLMWFFFTFGFAGLILQIKPTIEIDSQGDGGILQVYYAVTNLSDAESSPAIVLPGRRTVSAPLAWSSQDNIRLDPISHIGHLTIQAIRYRYLFFIKEIDLHEVSALRGSTALSISYTNKNWLRIRSWDDDPRISVPTPKTLSLWRMAGICLAFLPIFSLLVATLLLREKSDATPNIPFQAALIFLGINYAIFVYLVGWTDAYYPIMDDWRYFYPGRFSLIENHATWMKVAGNDTYFLTGQVIDWALLKVSGGSTYFIRLFSLALLAVYLAFASALSEKHAGRWAGFAVLALCLTLTGRSYWTQQFIAYHQFIPVLSLIGMLWIMKDLPQKQLMWSARLTLSLLTLTAGLAYISGAFLIIGLLIAYLIARPGSSQQPPYTDRLLFWHIGLPAIITLIFQVYMVSSAQGSLLEESHAGKLIWPWEARFWAFFFGLFGRAFSLSGKTLALDVAITIFCIMLATHMLIRGILNRPSEKDGKAEWVALSLYAGVFVYAALVALGRAAFGAHSEADLYTVSAAAKLRFHYWWLAALLPVAIAISMNKLVLKKRLSCITMTLAASFILIGKCYYFINLDLSFYEDLKRLNKEAEACVRAAIVENNGSLQGRIECAHFYPVDLGSAIRLSEKKGMYFMRRLLQVPED